VEREVPASLGQDQATSDLSAPASTLWPKPNGRPAAARILPAASVDTAHPAHPRADGAARFSGGPYHEIDVAIDPHQTFWCYLKPNGVPSFTHRILRELADMQRSIKRMFAECGSEPVPPIRHFVVGSRTPGIFNMGGDLAFFADCIRTADRSALKQYAHACIEVVYNNATSLDLPIITIALVQGDALGGGFEAVLSCNVIVAEKHAKMGLPEILFNLFPGMGAYSLLARKLDAARAERMILSGRIYGAQELYELGVVDVLAEDGDGEEAVRQYIARNARRHGAHRAICEVRRRINPLAFDELEDITRIWIETALGLDDADLRKMERLATAQRRRIGTVPQFAAAAR
jgi:DSF synthase